MLNGARTFLNSFSRDILIELQATLGVESIIKYNTNNFLHFLMRLVAELLSIGTSLDKENIRTCSKELQLSRAPKRREQEPI